MSKRKSKTFSERRQERKNRLAERKERARELNFMKSRISPQFELDIETLSTPFGDIETVEADLFHTARNPIVVREIMNFSLEMEENDEMTETDTLAFLKNMSKRYPNEPLVFFELGKAYFDLKKTKSFKQQIKENYERFKAYPMIDIAYADLLDKVAKSQFFKEEFGGNLYLPDVYPERAYFDIREVRLYYVMALRVLTDRGLFDEARQCLEVIKKISSQENSLYMESIINFKQYPKRKWWNLTKAILFLLFLLGLVVSCIWGIISFFRWLF